MHKLSLAHLPTKLHPLPRLSQYLAGPEIWIKRDDNTGLALGGNKARKLEYLLADALTQDSDLIITAGGIQSNHARMTAAAAASLGLACHLVLRGQQVVDQGNLLLDKLFGANIHLLQPDQDREAKMASIAAKMRAQGRRPYIIGIGGSNSLGSLGYVDAISELCSQSEPNFFAEIVVAVGSGGTYAGLLSGITKHKLRSRLYGICVDDGDFQSIVQAICDKGQQLYGLPMVTPDTIMLDANYIGPGYGQPSAEALEAIDLLARLEGILLDPVYTGKAMAGLIDRIRSNHFDPAKPILFWHTGGAPALFAR